MNVSNSTLITSVVLTANIVCLCVMLQAGVLPVAALNAAAIFLMQIKLVRNA